MNNILYRNTLLNEEEYTYEIYVEAMIDCDTLEDLEAIYKRFRKDYDRSVIKASTYLKILSVYNEFKAMLE